MKQVKFTFIIAIFSMALITTSCKKDEPTPEKEKEEEVVPTPVTSTFTAKVEGEEYTYSTFSAKAYDFSNTILVNASKPGGAPTLGLAFPDDIAAGTYSFKGGTGEMRGMYNTSADIEGLYNAPYNTGSLVITSHDLSAKVVKGTFNFVAEAATGNPSEATFDITNGAFTVQY